MNTRPYWFKSAELPRFPTQSGDVTVDLAVVGGGIAGITAAFLAKRAGLKVALLERDQLARVDTGHTTAHVTTVTDLRLQEIQKTFGDEIAARVWEAGMTALGRIESVVRSDEIDCDFRRIPGYLHAAAPEDAEELQREAEVAAELGIAAKFVTATPFFGTPGVRFEQQALFHPLAYLAALAQRIPGDGSHVFENSSAEEISEDSLRTAGGHIKFKHVFVATHNPLVGDMGLFRATLLQTKLALYTSYVLGGRLPRGRIPEGSYWDTDEPYRYLRVDPRKDHDRIIYGGEDHKTGQETDTLAPYARLEEHLRSLVPEVEIDSRWSGQVIETNDGLPFIGEVTDRQYIATGFAGNGMTFGTLSAQMLVWDIMGVDNPWKEIFDPHRRKWRGGTWDYVKENKDFPYYLVRKWLARPEAASVNDIPPGEGRTIVLDKKKVAAYRDPQGNVTLCSAVCTHMKCIVGWNAAERTWDCPCHGSRFQPDGSVISGPAEEPLPRLDAATAERRS